MFSKSTKMFLLFTALLCFAGRGFAASTVLGSVTIGGGEQSSGSTYDTGTVTATINGVSVSFTYGQFSTPAGVASALGALISNNCNMPVYAHVVGTTLTFYQKGSNTISSMSISSVSNNPSLFPSTSFQVNGGSTWSPPPQDTPTVSVTVVEAPYGGDPRFTIIVSNQLGDIPTGTVTLTIQNTGPTPFNNTIPGIELQKSNGYASASATWASCDEGCSLYPAEAYSVSAQYNGDANDAPETGSTTFSVGLDDTDTTIQTGCPGSVTEGQNNTYTVQVAAQNAGVDGMATPTGNMILYDLPPSGQSVNTTQALGQGSGTSATTSFSIALQGTGAHTLKASYQGDGNYNGSTSNQCQVTVSVTCNYAGSRFYCDEDGYEWEDDYYSCSDGSGGWSGWYYDGFFCGGGGPLEKGSPLNDGPLMLKGPSILR